MTQEEIELLFQDLCARLPYGVKVSIERDFPNNPQIVEKIAKDGEIIVNDILAYDIYYYKPYLRSLSSMTEKEYTKYRTMQGRNCDYGEATICVRKSLYSGLLYDDNEPVKITVYYPNPVIQDWLNKKMFDYRGLIPMGLALEAPEEMYSIK